MGVYSKRIEDILTKFPMFDNELFKYDNYTYHIQFYLLNPKNKQAYENERFASFESYGLLNNSSDCAKRAEEMLKQYNKIIIAESGITNDVFIKDLTITTHPAYGDENVHAASEEFKLKIVESAGNGLVNKMHLVSTLLGYRSYIDMPVFISIWFTGYDNTNKENPEVMISDPIYGRNTYTFQCVIEEVTTSVDMESTTYDMILRPTTDIGLKSTYSNMNNIQFEPWEKGCTFASILEKLKKYKNNELMEAFRESYVSMYGKTINGSLDAVDIRILYKGTDSDRYYKTLTDTSKSYSQEALEFLDEYQQKYDRENYLRNWTTGYKNNPEYQEIRKWQEENKAKFDLLIESTDNRGWFSKFWNSLDPSKIKASKETLNSLMYDFKPEDLENHVDGYWPGGIYKPQVASNICSMISEIWNICAPKSGIIPTFTMVPSYIGDYGNKAYYKIILYVTMIEYPGLVDLIQSLDKNDYYKNANETQKAYLDFIINQKSLLKRYHYLLNGKDTSVLSYDTKEDMFWYLNAGSFLDKLSQAQTPSVNQNDVDVIVNELNVERRYIEYVSDIVESKIDDIKNNNPNNHRITIDDLYFLIDEYSVDDISSSIFRAAQLNDLIVELQTQQVQENTEKNDGSANVQKELNSNINKSMIGAKAMLSHDQKLELKLKIIGDPYWISFCSEDVPTLDYALPHIVMCIKTYSKLNEQDTPVEDKMMELNTIYTVTDITSTFSDGVFTQELHGYVPLPFTISGQPEEYDKKEAERLRTMKILENSKGELWSINQLNDKLNEKSVVFKKPENKYSTLDKALGKDKLDETIKDYNQSKKSVVFKKD